MSPVRYLPILTLLTLAACGGPSGDVLIVSIDTLRADHLGIYGYARPTSPALDRWFGDGVVYERAYSTESSTPPSVVSLLSGKLPEQHGVRFFFQRVDRSIPLLPDRLPPEYQTAAFVSNMVIGDRALGIGARFDHYDDRVDPQDPLPWTKRKSWFERRATQTTDAVLAWLRSRGDPGRPAFVWVHYIDPHGPYRPPRDVFTHPRPQPLDPSRLTHGQRQTGIRDALEFVDRYDGEILYVDAEIDRLLRGVDELRGLDSTLVILTADHGETLAEPDRELWFAHGYHVHEELIRVPMLVRGPGVLAARSERLASLVDVAPTVLRFTGVATDGVDLRDPSSIPENRAVIAEAAADTGGVERTCPKTEPSCYWQTAITASERITKAYPRTFTAGRTLTPDIREQLEALGYVVE